MRKLIQQSFNVTQQVHSRDFGLMQFETNGVCCAESYTNTNTAPYLSHFVPFAFLRFRDNRMQMQIPVRNEKNKKTT